MTPPRLARWLLDRLLDADAREAIRGDLDEEFATRLSAGGSRARWWYWRQTLASVAFRTRDRVRGSTALPTPSGGRSVLEMLFTELRQIVRALRRSPGFVTAVVGPLMLALALTTSIVSVVQAVLIRDLPFNHPERLVVVGEADAGDAPENTSFTTISDLRARTKTLQTLVAIRGWQPTLTSPAVERLSGMRVSSDFFSMLGATPALGRDFQAADDSPDARFVVILSHRLWQRAFNADPGAINRTIRLNETNYRVVGVMPAAFEPVVSSQFFTAAEIWAPLGYAVSGRDSCRGCRHLRALGALAAGSTIDQAREELGTLHRAIAAQYPRDYGNEQIKIERLQDRIVRPFATTLLVLTGAVALVLIIAVANAASLMLTRASDLEHEMGLRAALGAGRGRLLRHRLLEALVVAGAAGCGGAALGAALTEWLVANAPDALPRADQIALNVPVVLALTGITLAVAMAVALAPAIGGSRIDAVTVSRTRSTANRRLIRVREALIVADVALALTLSVCAGVMVRSVNRLLAVQPGFQSDDVFTVQMSLVGPRWATDDAVRAFQRGVLERVKALPGASAVALSGQMPLSGGYDRRGGFLFERQTGRAEDAVEFERYSISPDYLRVMGIPLLRGRTLSDRDGVDQPPVMLISEAAAQRFWPGQDPLGRKVVFDEGRPPVTIVGVVGDVRHYRLEDPPAPQMYMPQEQMTDSFLTLAVKGAGFDHQWPAVRSIVRELGSDVPLYSFGSMAELVSQSAAPRRFVAFLLGLFAVLATAMTAAGVYGLVAYTVTRRTREFGIRIALGASRTAIRRLVLARGLWLTAIGVGAGLLASRLAAPALGGIAIRDVDVRRGIGAGRRCHPRAGGTRRTRRAAPSRAWGIPDRSASQRLSPARALLSGGGSAMPRPRRTHLDAPFFHVLNRSVRRAPIFRRPQDYRAFLGVLQEGLERFPVRLVAFCVLSNRWHLVLEPAGTEGMIRFMHWVSTTHAVRWHLRRASTGNGPVYQGRYHSIPIEGTGDLMRICRYVERHALTAGLVRRAQDWPWCSLAERLRPQPEVSLKPARFLTSQAWIDHVNAAGPLWEQVDDPADLVRCDRALRTLTRAPAPRRRDRGVTTGQAPRRASTRAPGQPPC